MSIDFAYERVYKLKVGWLPLQLFFMIDFPSIHIHYLLLQSIQVHKNDEDSWDFTAAAQQPGGILKRPRPGLDWDRDFQRASRPSRNWSDYEHHSRMPMGYETSDGRPMRKMMKVGSPDHRRRRNEGNNYKMIISAIFSLNESVASSRLWHDPWIFRRSIFHWAGCECHYGSGDHGV